MGAWRRAGRGRRAVPEPLQTIPIVDGGAPRLRTVAARTGRCRPIKSTAPTALSGSTGELPRRRWRQVPRETSIRRRAQVGPPLHEASVCLGTRAHPSPRSRSPAYPRLEASAREACIRCRRVQSDLVAANSRVGRLPGAAPRTRRSRLLPGLRVRGVGRHHYRLSLRGSGRETAARPLIDASNLSAAGAVDVYRWAATAQQGPYAADCCSLRPHPGHPLPLPLDRFRLGQRSRQVSGPSADEIRPSPAPAAEPASSRTPAAGEEGECSR